MDKNKIAKALRKTDGSVRKTALLLRLDFEELKTFVRTEPDLNEVREFARTRAALLKADGNKDKASHALGITRQGLYHRIHQSKALQDVVEEIRQAKKSRVKDIGEMLATVDAEAMQAEALRIAAQKNLSARVVGRERLIAKLQELTLRSERDIIAELKQEPLKSAFEAKLPPSNSKKFEADHRVFPVSLTHEQWEWMRSQRRGTAADLIRKSKPIEGPIPPDPTLPCQTSYSIPLSTLNKLDGLASGANSNPSAVFRHIINTAMQGRRTKHHRRAA